MNYSKISISLLMLQFLTFKWTCYAAERLVKFEQNDFIIKESRGFYLVVPRTLRVGLGPILAGQGAGPPPKCEKIRENLKMFNKTINRCINDNSEYRSDADCSSNFMVINENRFGIFLEEDLPVGEIKNDAVQFWRISFLLPKVNEQELLSFLSADLNVSKSKIIFLYLKPIDNKKLNMKNSKFSLGDESILKRLLSTKGYSSDEKLVSYGRNGELITTDRILACDLLEGNARISFDSSLSFEKTFKLDMKKLEEIYLKYKMFENKKIFGESSEEIAALAGMRFQKIFGELEEEMLHEEYVALFRRVFPNLENGVQFEIYDDKQKFFELFPGRSMSFESIWPVEGQIQVNK